MKKKWPTCEENEEFNREKQMTFKRKMYRSTWEESDLLAKKVIYFRRKSFISVECDLFE